MVQPAKNWMRNNVADPVHGEFANPRKTDRPGQSGRGGAVPRATGPALSGRYRYHDPLRCSIGSQRLRCELVGQNNGPMRPANGRRNAATARLYHAGACRPSGTGADYRGEPYWCRRNDGSSSVLCRSTASRRRAKDSPIIVDDWSRRSGGAPFAKRQTLGRVPPSPVRSSRCEDVFVGPLRREKDRDCRTARCRRQPELDAPVPAVASVAVSHQPELLSVLPCEPSRNSKLRELARAVFPGLPRPPSLARHCLGRST